jgi:hypothetical protein
MKYSKEWFSTNSINVLKHNNKKAGKKPEQKQIKNKAKTKQKQNKAKTKWKTTCELKSLNFLKKTRHTSMYIQVLTKDWYEKVAV